jgi:16S rRNA (guanine527-N7)-methyltransferase
MHDPVLPLEPGNGPDGALWRTLGWQPQPAQLAQLIALQGLLRQWNQRLNLTRLVEGDDYWIAQVFDSLWPLVPLLNARREADPAPTTALTAADGGAGPETGTHPAAAGLPGSSLNVIDVGTGGGFPGLAVAIALPAARVTLVDSVQRKLDAVAAMAAELGLSERVCVRAERVERTGRERSCRGHFQLAMARAVAAAPVVAEYLVPLLASDGQALLYRGQWSGGDQQELERALGLLNARIERSEQRELPAGRGLRTALTVVPAGVCPGAYPRAVGVPARQPLGQAAGAGVSTPPRSSNGREARRGRA